MTAELALGADVLSNTRHLSGKGAQSIDRGVDGVFQFEDLTFSIDRNFLRQVAIGDGSRYLGDVTDLSGKVAG